MHKTPNADFRYYMHEGASAFSFELAGRLSDDGACELQQAFRLYLPEVWTKDGKRWKKTGVPDEIQFQTKTNIALEQIQRARKRGLPECGAG